VKAFGVAAAKSYTAKAKTVADKRLSHPEAAHVVAYTGSGYREINKGLRAGTTTADQWDHINSLNNALGKLPNHEGTVYRKADLNPETAVLYKKGDVIEEKAFTSSSKNSGTWYGQYRFEIASRTGKDVQKYSLHKSEAEVLFRSGTKFRVVERATNNAIRLEEVV
jgi:hypothetical protein